MKLLKRTIFSVLVILFATALYQCSPKTSAKVEGAEKKITKTEQTAQETETEESKPSSVRVAAPPPPPPPLPSTGNTLGNKEIPIDPDIRMGTLENGMKYYIKKNGKPENRAELRLALDAGSILEDEDQLGLAHFIEHMCFNGTKNFEKNDLIDYLESVGTKFGPDLNAYTSFDETVYMLQVRTDDEDLLHKGLLVLEDWAGAVTFDHEEIDKERGVVISEWRTRLSADQRMSKKYFPIIYQESQYAKRLPIGDPEIIENAGYETIKRYYRDWYRPNLMAVVAVGDFDVDQMEKEITSRFSRLKNPENPRPRKKYKVPGHEQTLVSICSDEEAAFTNVRIMYKHKRDPMKTMEDYRENLVRNLYNRMLNARLNELAQKADPPFLYAFSGYNSSVGDLATYSSFAMVPEGGATRGLNVLLEENTRVLKHGFNQSELDRQKVEMMENMEKAYKERDKMESGRLVMRYVYHFLDDNPIPGMEDQYKFYQILLPTITLDEINRLAEQWITDENRVIVITGPEKEEVPLPSEGEVLSALEETKNKEVTPYVDKVSDDPLFDADLKVTPVVEVKEMETVGVTEWTLANGVKVVLKQTDFKNDEVLMSATSEGGHSLYSDEDYIHASNASSIVNESGLGTFDNISLRKKLTGKTVRVSPYIGEMYEGMRGSASPDDLETLFQLVYLYFTQPRKDQEAFQSFIAQQKIVLKNLTSNPIYYFRDQATKIKYDNHPRRKGFMTEGELDKISLDRAFEIYRDRFADASDFTFFFVGNFDAPTMKELAGKYLGNLPSTKRVEKWKDVDADLVNGKIEKTLVKGQAPKAIVEITFHGPFTWTRQNRYDLNSTIDLLSIKMRESMREDKGGVYGVGVYGGASQYPESTYSIIVSFQCDPADTEDLIRTAMNDIKTVKEEGAVETDLTKVKETQRQERIKQLEQNRFWSRQVESYYENGLDLNDLTLESFEKLVDGLSSNAVKAVANKYFDENNMIKLVMKPEPGEEN